uniref:hypothetical protein n=1 Tax=Prevotella pallens TaxID=60133 RepID=UPI003C728542
KLETNQAKKTIKAKDPVRFKQFGSIVRLKVTNNTGFGFKYDGVRIITSNILVGQFDQAHLIMPLTSVIHKMAFSMMRHQMIIKRSSRHLISLSVLLLILR